MARSLTILVIVIFSLAWDHKETTLIRKLLFKGVVRTLPPLAAYLVLSLCAGGVGTRNLFSKVRG